MTYSIDFRRKVLSVREQEELTIAEVVERFGVAKNAIFQALSTSSRSPIKTLRHPKGNDAARQHFQETIAPYEAEGRPIIYIDESGFAHGQPVQPQRLMPMCLLPRIQTH